MIIAPPLSATDWQANGYGSWATASTVEFDLNDTYRAASLVSMDAVPISGTRITVTVDASTLAADGFFVGFLNDTDYTTLGSSGSDMGQRPEDATGVAFNVYGTEGIRGRRGSAVETTQVDTATSPAATWALDFSLSGTTVSVVVSRDSVYVSTLSITGVTYGEGLVYVSAGTGTGGGGTVVLSEVSVSKPTVTEDLKFELGLGSYPFTPLASVSWSDVTSDVLLSEGVSFNRGRSSQDEAASPGRLSLTLNNADLAVDRTNLVTNPTGESGTTGWTTVANCTVGTDSVWSSAGALSFVATCTAMAGGNIYFAMPGAYRPPITEGATYTASATFRADTVARGCRLDLQWYNSSNVLVGTSVYGTQVTNSTSADTRVSVTGTAPSGVGAVKVAIIVRVMSVSLAEIHRVDGIMLEESPAAGDYFDGSTTGYEWTGTAYASTSRTAASLREGRWTVGGGNVTGGWDLRTPVRVRHTTHGVLWLGYVDAAVGGWRNGVRPIVEVAASDRLAQFARRTLAGAGVAEIEKDDPYLFLPLTEDQGDTVGDRMSPRSFEIAHYGDGGQVALAGATSVDGAPAADFRPSDSATAFSYLTGHFAAQTHRAGEFTFELMFCPTAFESGYIACLREDGTLNDLRVHWNGGAVSVTHLPPTGNSINLNITEDFRLGEWHHLAIIVDYGGSGSYAVSTYLDGAASEYYYDAGTIIAPSRLDVGGSATSIIAGGFTGHVAAVAFHDSALDIARFADHAAAFGLTAETTAERWSRVCDLADLDAADYAVTGSSLDPAPTVLRQVTYGKPFIDAAQECADVEDGVSFLDRTGVMRFHRRGVRVNAAVGLTLAPTDLDADVDVTSDAARMVNDVTVSRVGGATQRIVNDFSVAYYGQQDRILALPFETDTQAADRAEWDVYEFAYPRPYVEAVTVDLVTRAATVDVADALTADVSTRLQLTPMPTPTSPAETVDLFVEGISDSITHEQWRRTFATSSATAKSDVFTLDDADLGDLDTGGVLA